MYVHDGPPGREAWVIEVSRQGRATRWIFVRRAAFTNVQSVLTATPLSNEHVNGSNQP
jgi:hypothetical protein